MIAASWPFLIMCIVSMPAITARAQRKFLNPSIGRTMRLTARDLLRQDYARFGEGFASLDLVEGKRLLDAMRRSESREPLLPA